MRVRVSHCPYSREKLCAENEIKLSTLVMAFMRFTDGVTFSFTVSFEPVLE